jgi:uncharacterized UBP type Zn finger protein
VRATGSRELRGVVVAAAGAAQGSAYGGSRQQDPHEFLMAVLEQLEAEEQQRVVQCVLQRVVQCVLQHVVRTTTERSTSATIF